MAYQRNSRNQENKNRESATNKPKNEKYGYHVTVSDINRNGYFNVIIDHMTFYGLRLAEGKNGTFVSFASRKGTDGKYYSHYYIPWDETTQNEVIEQVLDKFAEEYDRDYFDKE